MLSRITFEKDNEAVAILRLVAFFDLFDHPLTLFEINDYFAPFSDLSALPIILNELVASGRLWEYEGFYLMPNRRDIIETRRRRYNYSLRKIKIAKRFAKVFALFPPVKMVALANSIGRYNLRDGSDIDFFIITSSRRVWLSRLFCTGLAKILNSRPDAKTKKDKICLSFYLAENKMSLSPLKLEDGDPYFDFWERQLLPLIDKDNTYSKFKDANRSESIIAATNNGPSNIFKRFGDCLEKMAEYFQILIMPDKLKKAAASPDREKAEKSGVVIGDGILKLYLGDKRLEIKKRYEENLGKVL